MGKKMAVVGAGAAGSYIGAFLTREGHDLVRRGGRRRGPGAALSSR